MQPSIPRPAAHCTALRKRPGERVRGAALECGRQLEAALRRGTWAEQNHLIEPRRTEGERAGLVEYDAVRVRKALECAAAGHEYAYASQTRRGGGERCGGGQ